MADQSQKRQRLEICNLKSSICNPDNLSVHVFAFDDQLPYANWQLEPSRARTARIEIKHPFPGLLLRDMAMPRDHYSETSRFRFKVQLTEIVQNVDGDALYLDHVRFGQPSRPRFFVDVASDRRQGSKRCEFFEDLGLADVARMDDVIRPAKRVDRFRPKQPVRVGDDTYADALLTSRAQVCLLRSSIDSSLHATARLASVRTYRKSSLRWPISAAVPWPRASVQSPG